ncbi:MAG: 30S ribosomal protein S4e [Candidatus Bilamarchaeaceae archaeon]
MGKRGGTHHIKRLAAPKALYLLNKKKYKWVVKPMAGPHNKESSVPLGVLLRDLLNITKTMREVKKILNKSFIKVDNVIRKNEKFPVGLLDVVSLVPANKHYRILVDSKGRLKPVEINKDTNLKVAKVINKTIIKNGKMLFTLHDGKNILGDNHISIGDSLVLELPSNTKEKIKLVQHLKLEPGTRCYISKGKHAGKIVTFKELIKRASGKEEALVSDGKSDFITVSNYVVAVGDYLF